MQTAQSTPLHGPENQHRQTAFYYLQVLETEVLLEAQDTCIGVNFCYCQEDLTKSMPQTFQFKNG